MQDLRKSSNSLTYTSVEVSMKIILTIILFMKTEIKLISFRNKVQQLTLLNIMKPLSTRMGQAVRGSKETEERDRKERNN